MPDRQPRRRLRALVLGGGRGRRLEAVVRHYSGQLVPKQFCRFGGTRSLLQDTLRRIEPLVPPHDTVVVVDATQMGWAEAQLGGLEGLEILPQPCDRGTAPGVLYPLARTIERDPEAIVLVVPSDHGFADEEAFRVGVLRGRAAVAEGTAEVVVYGVRATAPNSDYGWMVPGGPLDGDLWRISAFVEKPDPARARHVFACGGLWNTMIVVARAEALMEAFRRSLPGWAAVFDAFRTLPQAQRAALLRVSYDRLAPADFSRDILGTATGLALYAWPDALGWTDLGTPERMLAWLKGNGRFDAARADRLPAPAEGSADRRQWTST